MLEGRVELYPALFIGETPMHMPTAIEIRAMGDLMASQMEALDKAGWEKTAFVDGGTIEIAYICHNVLSVAAFQVELDVLRTDGFDLEKAFIYVYDTDAGELIWTLKDGFLDPNHLN